MVFDFNTHSLAFLSAPAALEADPDKNESIKVPSIDVTPLVMIV
jgi:hypothetical protein